MEDQRKKLILSILGVFLLVVVVAGVSFAFFNYTRTGSPNTVSTGRIYFSSTQNNTLNLTNVFPLTSTQAGTANLDAVTINILGDTEYTGGIEYLITIDQVNNVVNGKTIPLNFLAEVSNTGSIGTSSNDYWNARESKAASIYELTSTGEVTDGQYVLAGYIKSGATGVNGSITIKAYVDASRIAISDTLENGPIEETGYVNGTTSDWVKGRTVLTTTEWNSLRGNSAISFKVKAEANEGIWVPEPAVGTIDSCPGCVFTYTTNQLWTSWNTNSETPTQITTADLATSAYSTDYRNIVTGSEKQWFLGLIIENDEITRAFACGLKDGTTPFCIEGDSDGTKYTSNSSLLNGPTLWNTTCTVGTDEYDNTINMTGCGLWDDSSVSAGTDSIGGTAVGITDYMCYVDFSGKVSCREGNELAG